MYSVHKYRAARQTVNWIYHLSESPSCKDAVGKILPWCACTACKGSTCSSFVWGQEASRSPAACTSLVTSLQTVAWKCYCYSPETEWHSHHCCKRINVGYDTELQEFVCFHICWKYLASLLSLLYNRHVRQLGCGLYVDDLSILLASWDNYSR